MTILTSLRILEKRCRRWFRSSFGTRPAFTEVYLGRLPFRPARSTLQDVVFFGGLAHDLARWAAEPPPGEYRLWVLCARAKEVMRELHGIPARHIGVIPRYELFPARRPRRPFPARGERWTLVYAGRLTDSKNIVHLLHVAALLQTEYGEDVQLSIFGNVYPWGRRDYGLTDVPNYRQALLRCIHLETEWKSFPEFKGAFSATEWLRQPLVRPVLIVLSTDYCEDFNVAAAQAQAEGWPCIATDWGGLADLEGSGVIRVPARALGGPHQDLQEIRRRSRAIAAKIFQSLKESRRSPDLSRDQRPTRARAPEPIGAKKLAELHRRAETRIPEAFRALRGSDYGALGERSGQKYMKRYRGIFSGKRPKT